MRKPAESMFAGPGCPFCRAALDAEQRALTWFLMESYYEPPTLLRLRRSRFCRRHAADLASPAHPQLAATFQWLADSEMARLADWRATLARRTPLGTRRGRGRPNSLPAGVPVASEPPECPACAAGDAAVAVEANEAAEGLEATAYRTVYLRSDGLCLPHAWQLMAESPPETAAWLAQATELRLGALLADVEAVFHRRDYRFADEPRGAEQGAWLRGVGLFWMHAAPRGAARPEPGAAEPRPVEAPFRHPADLAPEKAVLLAARMLAEPPRPALDARSVRALDVAVGRARGAGPDGARGAGPDPTRATGPHPAAVAAVWSDAVGAWSELRAGETSLTAAAWASQAAALAATWAISGAAWAAHGSALAATAAVHHNARERLDPGEAAEAEGRIWSRMLELGGALRSTAPEKPGPAAESR